MYHILIQLAARLADARDQLVDHIPTELLMSIMSKKLEERIPFVEKELETLKTILKDLEGKLTDKLSELVSRLKALTSTVG